MNKLKQILIKRILPLFYFDTFGNIAIASLVICTISGLFLALVYDVSDPYKSVSKILLVSSSGTFYRNLHYWSAQFFLVFTLLHIWDHFRKNTEDRVKPGVWLRLTISIAASFFVMLTGFILKADADSMQAFRILDTLFRTIPLLGDTLAGTFLGNENDLQLMYVHHIATATIFLFIITYEHARTVWTRIPTTIYTLIYTSLLSLFLTPMLHDSLDPIIKGPWYFLGLQEILHWISNPLYTITFSLLLFLVFYYLPKINNPGRNKVKNTIVYFTVAYFMLTIFAYYFRGENWELVWPWQNPKTNYFTTGLIDFNKSFPADSTDRFDESLNRIEGCLSCHNEMKGFTASHSPDAIGCSSCHAGNPFSFDKDEAHAGMVLIPGNEKDYNRSCGTSDCHPDIVSRVPKSIMSTLTGMISVNKFVFDESENLDEYYHVKNLGFTAAESHLRNLCVSCHIGNEKLEFGPINELSRGGGCNACHLNYSLEALNQLNLYTISKSDNTLPKTHPSLSLKISNDHCFGCHSRSSRISTNYEGWHETKLYPDELEDTTGYRILEDERVFEFVKADVHHEAGMECIDCHNSYETMGDGKIYLHKEDQVKIQCIDCHLTSEPETITIVDFDQESAKIAGLRELDTAGRNYLVISKSGYPLVNTYMDSINKPVLITKNEKKVLQLTSPAVICAEGSAHSSLSCESCHTAWVPQCIGCHTEYDPLEEGFDLLANEDTEGTWLEHIGDFFAELPTLGIIETSDSNRILSKRVYTFIPGMIMTLDKSGYEPKNQEIIFKRLFSPSFSHTIRKESRDCKSCHNNPLAIGYGRGKLDYIIENGYGNWDFTPKYALSQDELPEDAWIGFLKERNDQAATRSNARPFSIEEQKRILKFGSCLTCHDQNSEFIRKTLTSYDDILNQLSPECILPRWQ